MNELNSIHKELKGTRHLSNRGIDLFLKNCYSYSTIVLQHIRFTYECGQAREPKSGSKAA